MNHMTSIARSAGQQCARFIALSQPISRAKDFIQQIISYTQPVDNLVHKLLLRSRHSQFIHMLDMAGTLSARALRGSQRAPKRIARWVAFVIGISLSIPMAVADGGSIDAINPKTYIRLSMDHKQALCLIKLYGKESAFDSKAIGNIHGKHQTYGIPQIKNPLIYTKSPIEQIKYGMKYINHRYHGSTCSALLHFNRLGWH